MIVGAGLAGLIAAQAFPRAPIVEAAPEPRENHKALLRFRSDAVSQLTGVEFRAVTVRKGIFFHGEFVAPNIKVANLYTQKCLGGKVLGDRSIWSLDAVTRYVAPLDFHERLVDSVRHRIEWGADVDVVQLGHDHRDGVISTAPLPAVLGQSSVTHDDVTFDRAPIFVQRWTIEDCDTHQTVYFPSSTHAVYRASITGNVLIIEARGPLDGEDEPARTGSDTQYDVALEKGVREVFAAFGIGLNRAERLDSVEQRYGKIAPIDENARKAFVAELTRRHRVFSLGRFATWRNLLLDDVVQDCNVIKRLRVASEYERRMAAL